LRERVNGGAVLSRIRCSSISPCILAHPVIQL
jgi:hypothetical protein